FVAQLQRYTGRPDIAVGSPVANRTHAATEGLIGCFVNSLVLCTDLSGDPPFRALLARVRRVALGAYDHQDLPFERLVEEINPERDRAHTPLFQVVLVLQNAPLVVPALPGLRLSALATGSATAKFDLTLNLAPGEGGGPIGGVLEYDSDLFDRTTAAR